MRSSVLSRSCEISSCKHSSSAVCICCNQCLCIDHLKDHSNKQTDNQLISLTTEINILSDQFHRISLSEPNFLTTLDQWRSDAYRTIDRFYETQRRHFEQFIQENRQKQRKEIDHLRLKITDLNHEKNISPDDIYLIKDTIQSIEKDLNNLQYLHCHIRPLILDENFVTFRSDKITRDLLPLSRPYRTINIIDDSYCWMATNEKYLLAHHKPDLYLFDRQLSIIEKTPWIHGRIYVMCWSSTLNRFIVITNDTIYTIDENLLAIERCDLIHHHHNNNIYRNWRSGTCSNINLYLSTGDLGSSIYEFILLPSIQFVKEWSSPISCRHDEGIDDLCYRNDKFAIIIFHQTTNETRLDLRSSITLDTIWSIELSHLAPRRTSGCCWLNNDEWFVTDEYDFRIFHISADGHLIKSEKYDPAPYNALLYGKDMIAIRTIEGINLHKLNLV